MEYQVKNVLVSKTLHACIVALGGGVNLLFKSLLSILTNILNLSWKNVFNPAQINLDCYFLPQQLLGLFKVGVKQHIIQIELKKEYIGVQI